MVVVVVAMVVVVGRRHRGRSRTSITAKGVLQYR